MDRTEDLASTGRPAACLGARAAGDAEAAALRATVDLAPVGIAHFDAAGRFLLVNDRLCDVLGFTREELLTRTFQEITFPDDLARCVSLNTQLAEGAIPSYSQDKRFVRRDGTAVWVRISASVVRAADGALKFFIGIAEDISHQRKIEQRFETLANGIPQMVWIADLQGRRSWFNERWYEFTGLTFDDMRDHGWHQVLRPDYLPRIRDGQLACFARGLIWEDTVPLRRRDGVYRWFLSRAVPMHDASDAVTHYFGTNTDITELRAARMQLERAMSLREEMTAVLAHDLRSPLQTIAAAAAALARGVLSEDQRERLLGIVQRTSSSMARLIGDLLDMSRMEAGRFRIMRATLDVEELLAECCEMFDAQTRERGLALECDIEPGVGTVEGDRDRLMQVLSNLVGNALKFTPHGGRVAIRARTGDEGVQISVADTGPGVSPEHLQRIFERFWRADLESPDGTGLGLPIAKGIVEAHGGRIWAESPPGSGMTVHFTLPMHAQGEPADDPSR